MHLPGVLGFIIGRRPWERKKDRVEKAYISLNFIGKGYNVILHSSLVKRIYKLLVP